MESLRKTESLSLRMNLQIWQAESKHSFGFWLATHRDNGGSGTGVLGPGFLGTRWRGFASRRVLKSPVPERPVVPVCKIARLVLELFLLKKCGTYLLWAAEEED